MVVRKVKSKHYPSGFAYLLDARLDGTRVRQSFPTEKLAKDALAVARADLLRRKYSLPTDSKITLSDLVSQHISRTISRRPKAKWITKILESFRDYLGGERLVDGIKKADLRDFAEWREKAGLKPQSVNREIVEVKSCLTAATQYYRSLNDWQPPKATWLDETHDGRDRVWSEEEYRKVLEYCFQPKRGREQAWQVEQRISLGEMFIVISQTGLRPGEACRLKKTDVDFSENVIGITSRKGITSRGKARARKVPMTETCRLILARRVETIPGPHLFPNRDGSGPLSNYITTFRRICIRIGINYGHNSEGGVVLNDMRATAENRMLDAGYSAREVCDILGHSPETMARFYARTTKEKKQAAVESAGFTVHILTTGTAATGLTGLTEESEKKRKAG
jgi:integrase